jgi:hypothetical protein
LQALMGRVNPNPAGEPELPHAQSVLQVQCQVTGPMRAAWAQELGRVIGGVLGKRVERQTF